MYSSKLLTGDEMAGFPVININEGILKGGHRTGGGVHDETELYYFPFIFKILFWDGIELKLCGYIMLRVYNVKIVE